MTITEAKIPEEWIAAVHKLPVDDLGTKLEAATCKAAGLPLIASLALMALDTLGDAGINKLHTQSGHRISPSTMDGLVTRGLARFIDGPKRSWRITVAGKNQAELARAGVSALMARLTTRKKSA